MSEAEPSERVARNVYIYSPRDFHVAFGFSVLTLFLHTYSLIVEFKRAAEFSTLTSNTIPYLFLLIALCLLTNVVGLWLRRWSGILTSILSLAGVGVGYAFWYLYSRQILELLSSKPFYYSHPEAVPSHPFGLISATLINFVVLVMSGVLLIWEIKTLRAAARATSR